MFMQLKTEMGEKHTQRVRVRDCKRHIHTYLRTEKKTHKPNLVPIGLPFFSEMGPPHSIGHLSHIYVAFVLHVCMFFFVFVFWFLFRRTDFNVLTMDFRYKRWWTRRVHHQSVVSSEPNDINNEGNHNKTPGIFISFVLALISFVFKFHFWLFFGSLLCFALSTFNQILLLIKINVDSEFFFMCANVKFKRKNEFEFEFHL